MSPAEIDHDWRVLTADDEQGMSWAEYIAYWLQAQTPTTHGLRPTPAPSVAYNDLPWATQCLQDVFNG